VEALKRFAELELGTTVSRLAVAWVLANPAVQVAIVGTRSLAHVDDAIAASDLRLDEQALHPTAVACRARFPPRPHRNAEAS